MLEETIQGTLTSKTILNALNLSFKGQRGEEVEEKIKNTTEQEQVFQFS